MNESNSAIRHADNPESIRDTTIQQAKHEEQRLEPSSHANGNQSEGVPPLQIIDYTEGCQERKSTFRTTVSYSAKQRLLFRLRIPLNGSGYTGFEM